MIESKLQTKVVDLCKKCGILAFKVDSSSTRGLPDLTLVLPCGTVLFIELKTETGRLSALQKRIHEKLRGNKANVAVIRTIEEFETLITQVTD